MLVSGRVHFITYIYIYNICTYTKSHQWVSVSFPQVSLGSDFFGKSVCVFLTKLSLNWTSQALNDALDDVCVECPQQSAQVASNIQAAQELSDQMLALDEIRNPWKKHETPYSWLMITWKVSMFLHVSTHFMEENFKPSYQKTSLLGGFSGACEEDVCQSIARCVRYQDFC